MQHIESATIEEPRFARWLFASKGAAGFWLVVRLYLGYEWLHAGWEKILPLWRAKEPGIDFFLSKRVALPLFWERAIIEIVPRRAYLWEDGRTDAPPQVFELEGAGR